MNRIIFAIFILGLSLRVLFLSSYPIGFSPDEASHGYDAYSILKTGKDQWGKTLPLVFESFGDYKAPVYSYLTIPFVWLFGLSKFAVRLPNAFLGSLAIIIVYKLVQELCGYGSRIKSSKKSYLPSTNCQLLPIIASLLFAISPWHIAMSRGAYEANLTTFFLTLGIYLFFKFVNSNISKYLYLSVFVLGINMFSYHSAKLITPLIVIAMGFLFRDKFRDKVVIIKSAVIASLFIIFTASTFVGGAGTRVKDVSIFKLSLPAASTERIRAYNSGLPDSISRVFHNKYQVFIKTGISNYLSYFSPQFLFTRGAGEMTYGMNDDRGVLYWFELPLLIGFLMMIIKKRINRKLGIVVIWVLIAPIPASLAIGPGFAANRAVIMLPAIYILLAYGAVYIYQEYLIRLSIKFRNVALMFVFFITTLFFISFIENYFFVTPQKNAKSMLYGNLETSHYLAQNYRERNIIVSRKLSEPHIYVAFADKWDPKDYQKYSGRWDYKDKGHVWVDQMSSYILGNYTFGDLYYPSYKNSDTVMVGRPDEFPESVVPSWVFHNPDGTDAIYVVDPIESQYAKIF